MIQTNLIEIEGTLDHYVYGLGASTAGQFSRAQP